MYAFTKSQSRFGRFAKKTASLAGRPMTFLLAALLVLIWLGTGPLFRFSDTWQIGNQHHHDDCHVPDGLPDSEHAEPRY